MAGLEVKLAEIAKDVFYIKDAVDDVKEHIKKNTHRIEALENWKVKFVTKFSILSAIALAIGSFVAQLAISYITKLF